METIKKLLANIIWYAIYLPITAWIMWPALGVLGDAYLPLVIILGMIWSNTVRILMHLED